MCRGSGFAAALRGLRLSVASEELHPAPPDSLVVSLISGIGRSESRGAAYPVCLWVGTEAAG